MDTTFEIQNDQLNLTVKDGDLRVSFYGPRWTFEQDKLRRQARKTRVYTWGSKDVDFSDLPAGWEYSDDPEIKKACRAKNKQEISNMNDLRLEAQPLFEAVHQGELATLALRFSRYAGCSCGCSPGFIAPKLVTVTAPEGRTFFVEAIHIERKRKK